MGRIKNQDKYILDQQITANDYLVGSDAEDLGKRTKSFRVGDLAAFMGGTNGTPTWENTLLQGNTTSTNTEYINGAKLQLTNLSSYSPILGSPFELSINDSDSTGSMYPALKYIKRSDASGSESTIVDYNFLEHNLAAGKVAAFSRGQFNDVRFKGQGIINQMVGTQNQLRMQSESVSNETVTLVSTNENIITLGATALDGSSPFNGRVEDVLGFRADIRVDLPNGVVGGLYGIYSELDIFDGSTIEEWSGLTVDVTQTVGQGQILSGQFIHIDKGIDEGMANTNGILAINSEVDIPSFFRGSIGLGDGTYTASVKNEGLQSADIAVYLPSQEGTLAIEPILEQATVSGTTDIDWSKDTFNFTLTGNTTFTQSNLPAAGKTKTITIYIKTGNFDLNLPAEWDRVQGSYDANKDNQIVVEYINATSYWVSISNI